MAGTTTKSKQSCKAGSDLADVLVQFNNLVTAFDAVLAKLDLDAGVTDANYVALHGSTASKVGDMSGTAFTSSTI